MALLTFPWRKKISLKSSFSFQVINFYFHIKWSLKKKEKKKEKGFLNLEWQQNSGPHFFPPNLKLYSDSPIPPFSLCNQIQAQLRIRLTYPPPPSLTTKGKLNQNTSPLFSSTTKAKPSQNTSLPSSLTTKAQPNQNHSHISPPPPSPWQPKPNPIRITPPPPTFDNQSPAQSESLSPIHPRLFNNQSQTQSESTTPPPPPTPPFSTTKAQPNKSQTHLAGRWTAWASCWPRGTSAAQAGSWGQRQRGCPERCAPPPSPCCCPCEGARPVCTAAGSLPPEPWRTAGQTLSPSTAQCWGTPAG